MVRMAAKLWVQKNFDDKLYRRVISKKCFCAGLVRSCPALLCPVLPCSGGAASSVLFGLPVAVTEIGSVKLRVCVWRILSRQDQKNCLSRQPVFRNA